MIKANFDLYTPEWYRWHLRFIRMAEFVANWSKDPSTKCGAVIVRPNTTVASVGFNGFPRGCSDDPALYNDRDEKYRRVVHAEVNAVLHCAERPEGYLLYTWPPGFGPTCERCTTVVIQSGISHVIHIWDDSEFGLRWKSSAQLGIELYQQAGVHVLSLRKDCLDE